MTAAHCVRNMNDNSLHQIDTSLTCNSKGVIYLLQCNACNKQYVGQTSYNMKHRLAGHMYAFPRLKRSLYLHFTRFHKGRGFDINVTLLEQQNDTQLRLQGEMRWIETLDTYLPRGLNTIAPLQQST